MRHMQKKLRLLFMVKNLDGLMNARANALCGIVNGIDYEVYNPKTDSALAANYDQITFRKEKWKNKSCFTERTWTYTVIKVNS